MTARATMPFPARLKTELRIDPVMMLVSMALLFGGLVILASASITVSDNTVGEPFFYVERQLLAAAPVCRLVGELVETIVKRFFAV